MGMSASQARFLGLTARKNNVEFEGQQINQQRTSLSNQTATYNSQMLNLQVPTPPSVDQYTKTVYSWKGSDGSVNNIEQIIANANTSPKTYTVKYTQQANKLGEAYVSQTSPTASTSRTGTAAANYKYFAGGYEAGAVSDASITAALQRKYNSVNNTTAAKTFMGVDTDGDTVYDFYICKEDVDAQYPATGSSPTSVPATKYVIGEYSSTEAKSASSATLTKDANTGRLTSIILDGVNYTLAVTTEKDEEGYNQAMYEYEYQKAMYNKSMDDINSKLSIIQSQDKSLELQLKQLDTEQEAIQTEMDAVKKTIDKSIEGGFKTFA